MSYAPKPGAGGAYAPSMRGYPASQRVLDPRYGVDPVDVTRGTPTASIVALADQREMQAIIGDVLAQASRRCIPIGSEREFLRFVVGEYEASLRARLIALVSGSGR